MKQTRAEKIASTKLDKQIAAIYYAHCNRRQINVLDIGKIYAAGKEAAKAGEDVELAVRAAMDRFCTVLQP